MRPILLLIPLLAACPPTRGDDDDSACDTVLRVCATLGGPADQGTATIRQGPEDDAPLTGQLDAQGCVEFDVAAGDWEWRADAVVDTCASAFEPVTVATCQTEQVSVDLVQWCMDGR